MDIYHVSLGFMEARTTDMRTKSTVTLVLWLLFFAGCTVQPSPSVENATPFNQTSLPIDEVATATQEVDMFVLTSPAFSDGGLIDEKYTYKLGRQCSGENYSPPLEWKGIPEGTQSLLLIMIDPDGGNWVHWVLANIPANVTSLAEEIGGPVIGTAGTNDFGNIGYGGPCPPSGTHRYVFTLYALDNTLNVQAGATLRAITPLYQDHVLGKAVLTGLKNAK